MNNPGFRPGGTFLPEVTKNILIINVIMYLATKVLESRGVDLNDALGLHYFLSEKFRIWQFITYMFMHGDFFHIFFNMFAVFMFGAAMENTWGPRKFLTYYVLTGLGAAVTHYAIVYFEMQPVITAVNDYISSPSFEKLQALLSSDVLGKFTSAEFAEHKRQFIDSFNQMTQNDPQGAIKMSVDIMNEFKVDLFNSPVIIGASGAVFGLLLAFGMTFPNTILYVQLILPLKAKYLVIIYGLLELFQGVARTPGDNVAHFAHLGGLITGIIIILIWRYNNRRRQNNYFN